MSIHFWRSEMGFSLNKWIIDCPKAYCSSYFILVFSTHSLFWKIYHTSLYDTPTMRSPICGSLGLSPVGLITEITSSGSNPHFPLGRVSYVQIYISMGHDQTWDFMRFWDYLRPLSLGETTCCSRTPPKKEWSRWDYTVNSAKMSHSWWISNWRSRQKNSFTKHRQLGKSAIPLEAWEVVL